MKRLLLSLVMILLFRVGVAARFEKTLGGVVNYQYLGNSKLAIDISYFSYLNTLDSTNTSVDFYVRIGNKRINPIFKYSHVSNPSYPCVNPNDWEIITFGFIDTQRLQVMDTVKTVYSNKVLLCKELAQSTAQLRQKRNLFPCGIWQFTRV